MAISRPFIAVFVVAIPACSPQQGVGFVDGGGGGTAITSEPDAGSCNAATDCAMNEICQRNDFSCFSPPGTCAPSDAGCDRSHPICACDQHIYSDACAVRDARQNLGYDVKCNLSPGQFQCGHEVCSIATELCTAEGVCLPLPSACETPDAGCDCFADSGVVAGCYCVRTNAGYFAFECPN